MLSKSEELVMLAILRLGAEAYGVSVRRQILERAGKDYTYGTLYGLLRQLDAKGYVEKILGDSTPQQGGRRKTYFHLTPEGIEALKRAMDFHHLVWQDIDEASLNRGRSS